jgi:hypothetical protein
MIKAEAIVAGRTVVFDPSSLLPPSRRFFLITQAIGDDAYAAVNVTSRSSKRFSKGDLKRLVPAADEVHCDLNLTALMGRKVSVELTFGKTIGVVTEVQTKTTRILGVDVEVPVGVSIDGEVLRFSEVRGIDLAP